MHSVHWSINPPPQNTTPLFLAKPLPLNLQTVQAPFLGNPTLYIRFSWFLPEESDFSMNPKNIKVFHT